MKQKSETKHEVITTRKAAQILNLSVTSVQALADKGHFVFWKTSGGHRRYEKNSLLIYKRKMEQPKLGNKIEYQRQISIKVISNDRLILEKFSSNRETTFDAISLSFWMSLPEAYLSFSDKMPDVIIFGMNIPLKQQVENILAINDFVENSGRRITVIVLNDSKNLQLSVEHLVSTHVKIVSSILSDEWLKTFLLGISTYKVFDNDIEPHP